LRRLRNFTRLAVVDVRPLQEVVGYRWLFVGMLATQIGRQLTVVAVPVQVFQLTGSTLLVGLLGLAQLVPLLAVSLLGGSLADAVDRRRLLAWSQFVLALTAFGLLWNSLTPAPAVWPLFVLSAANAGISAIDGPARQALLPSLVGRGLFPAALALNQTLVNTAKAAVPALAGLLIATAGLPFTFAAEMVMFVVSGLLLGRIPEVSLEGERRKFGLASIAEGFRFLRPRRIIQAAFLLDLSAMVFGMPTALFPAIGTELLGGDAFTVGLLYSAPGIGALLAALTSGWVSLVRRQGVAVVVAIVGWGLSITIFGFSNSLALSLVMLGLAGAADVVSAIFRQSIVQLSVPDDLRGRLSSMHMAITAGGPRLGELESGVVASVTTVPFAVISGGIASLVGTFFISRWSPEFIGYVYRPDEGSSA
jgi:MFS family permease